MHAQNLDRSVNFDLVLGSGIVFQENCRVCISVETENRLQCLIVTEYCRVHQSKTLEETMS
jgi:hypothetical protein